MKNAPLVIVLSIGLLLASLGNGAIGYLKRIGLVERQVYDNYRVAYCDVPNGSQDSFANPCMCMRDPKPNTTGETQSTANALPEPKYIYQNLGSHRWWKLSKDALFGGFILLSLFLIRTGRARLPEISALRPAIPLVASVAIGLAISLASWGVGFAAIGLRSFEFLAIVLLGSWAVGGMHYFARSVGWLLIIQAALAAIELILGIPLRVCPFSFRVAGTMVLPNSLGIVTVVALAFYASFSQNKTWLPMLLLAAIAILAVSGSGTGLVALFALLAMLTLRRISGSGKWVFAVAMVLLGAIMMVKLPSITQRPDIYDSLFAAGGRVEKFTEVLRTTNALDTLFGRGLGFGTNTSSNLVDLTSAPLPSVMGTTEPFYADSTVTVLFTQMGILGIAAFYWLLGWAFLRDPVARPTYLVIGITSLTMNITELFPVNFLLGLLLAHTIFLSSRKPPEVPAP